MPPSFSNYFQHRTAVIATMHRKEEAIAPLLQTLNVSPQIPPDFDTDRFGTFTREAKRPGDALAAARLKAKSALEQTGETLAIASEGSFGPHPAFPWIASDRELVLLLDTQRDLEIIGQVLSTDTNYSHQRITREAEAWEFAAKVGFPSHGLVIIANPSANLATVDKNQVVKGILTETQLQEALSWAFDQTTAAHLETDMRAMHNPTRMKVIAQATEDLIQTIHQTCPQCDCPGFQVIEQKPGLPCALCHAPTSSLFASIYQCQKCHHRHEKQIPQGEEFADPAQCIYCNP